MVEPTKVCPKCKQRKPWSQFHVRRRWEDGTVRQVQSWCKLCQRARPVDRVTRKRTNRKYWRKYAQNTALYADHLERRRFRYHIRRGTVVEFTGQCGENHSSGPFAAWLEWVKERDGVGNETLAARWGISEKTIRECLKGRPVDLATVERALIADDSAMLRDLYPNLYAEAA